MVLQELHGIHLDATWIKSLANDVVWWPNLTMKLIFWYILVLSVKYNKTAHH